MSNVVDDRVVEMRFDNKDFESNVQTSLGTLEKLKSSLNLSDSARGLESIGSAAKSITFGGLSSGIEAVGSSFSALEVIAITALQNITNSVINTGRQMLNSLTIEPIKEGFSEYELKMDSVQTIMNGTGESLETVMKYLNELNTYADKTIYSFSDMTSSIGKFTNSGVKLDKAVSAIQGVSNLASVSGANAQQASHAMYNFAQALSSGSVKLIDWKSIENANMATVEFKNELLKTALELGTVTEKEGKFISTTTNAKGQVSDAFDAVTGFNDSLNHSWMTTEVLTTTLAKYSDETTELGSKAFAAAQDVKTFTQLMDTLKEAVGSGWAETWELVFGNFDEAKELWTGVSNVVGGFIDRQSKARNAMIENWKLLGGRTDVIESIKNIFNGLSPIVKQISDALHEVFEPLTGVKLADASKTLREFTEKFKLSGDTLQKIKNTFKGFFSLFDIGWQAIKAVGESLSPLLKLLPGFGKDVLGASSSLGQWITNIDESIKKNQTFKKAISDAIDFVKDKFELLNVTFESLTGLSFGDAFNKLVEKLKAAKDAVKEFLSSFKKEETTKVEEFGKAMTNPFEPVISLFNGLKKLVSGVVKLFKNVALPLLSGVSTAVGNIFGSFGESISNAAENIDVDKVLSVLSKGLFVLIGLKIKNFISNLSKGVDGGFLSKIKDITDGVGEIFDGVKESLESFQQDLKAGTLLKIAGAVAILTASILLLSGIEPEKISTGLGAMTTAFVELLGAMAFIDKFLGSGNGKSMSKIGTSMLKISAAMLIFSFAIAKLGSMDTNQLTNGIAAMGAALFEMFVFLNAIKENNIKKSANGLIGLGIALNIFAIAIKQLGSTDPNALIAGLIALGVVLFEVFAFLSAIKDNNIKKSASGLIGLGIALNIFTLAVKTLGNLSMEQLVKGLSALGAILLEVFAFMAATKSSDITKTAGGLIGLGIALNIFVLAISSLGALPLEQLIAGLSGLVVTLGAIAIAANLMNGTVSGAASMLIMVGALAILCPVLMLLGSMPIENIGKGLLVLAGAFVIIGVAGAVLAPIAPVILMLAGSLALFGVSALACGAAVGVLAAGLAVLATAGVAGVGALVIVIKSIITLIPDVIRSVGEGLLLVVEAIGNAAPTIMATVSSILVAIANAIISASPAIVTAAVVLIGALLAGIVTLVPEVIETAGSIIVAFLTGLATWVPAIVQAGVELVIAFINGVAEALRGNAGPLFEAVRNLFSSIIELVLTGLQTIVQAIPVIGDNLASGLDSMKDGIRETLTSGEMKSAASEAVDEVSSGIKDGKSDIKDASSQVGDEILDGLIGDGSEWQGGGRSVIDDFTSGISSGDVSGAVSGIEDDVLGGLEGIDTGSIGLDAMSEYAGGLSSGSGDVTSSIDEIISSATGDLESGQSDFLSAGKLDLDGYISGLSSKEKEAKSTSKKIASSSAKEADSHKSNFKSAGGHAGDGYVSGIKSKFDDAYKAGYTLGKKAKQGTADAQKSASPSKEFMKLGVYADQGYIKGLLSYASRVREAGGDVGRSALDSARGVLSRLNDSISSDLDTTPTIRPVLDLSNVQAGASSINRMLGSNYNLGAIGNLGAIQLGMQEIQNGPSTADMVDAINELRKDITNTGNTTYNIDGITYDDGSNIAEAVKTLTRAAIVGRRV